MNVVKEAELAQFGQIVLQQMMVVLTDLFNTQSDDRGLVRISFNAGPGVCGCGTHCDGANREVQRNFHCYWNGSVCVTFISAKGRQPEREPAQTEIASSADEVEREFQTVSDIRIEQGYVRQHSYLVIHFNPRNEAAIGFQVA